MGKTATSLNLDDGVYKKFKIKCIEKDMDYSDAMEQAMQDWMKK